MQTLSSQILGLGTTIKKIKTMSVLKKVWKFLCWIFPYLMMIGFGVLIYQYISVTIVENISYFTTIINGIISGIVTALILFIVQIIWRKNVLVWIENLLYQDVCIEGEWSGFLVPFIGLDDLDKISKEIAWKRFKEAQRERANSNSSKQEKTEEVEASVYNEKTGKEEKISAEVVLSEGNEAETADNSQTTGTRTRKIAINLASVPIIVKVEIKRVGHQVTGKLIEIGGASEVCSYMISGSFKNLILSGCYETTSKDNIDRGALSLMLFDNGKKLEGFFSSYSDSGHRVVPMQCVLRKRNQLSENDE